MCSQTDLARSQGCLVSVYLQAPYVDTLVGSLQLTRVVKAKILITAAAGVLSFTQFYMWIRVSRFC